MPGARIQCFRFFIFSQVLMLWCLGDSREEMIAGGMGAGIRVCRGDELLDLGAEWRRRIHDIDAHQQRVVHDVRS